MNRKYAFIVLTMIGLICFSPSAFADVFTLKSGKTISGTVVFENPEVVVVKDATGARFQIPATEIRSRSNDEAPKEEQPEEKEVNTKAGKTGMMLNVAAGAVGVPHHQWGAAANVDLLIGAKNLFDQHIFLGGGLGYHACIKIEGHTYSFLPIMLSGIVPLMKTDHAPYLGLNAGYGVALSKQYKGGAYVGIDFGYRYQMNAGRALFIGAYASFQQAKLQTSEVILGKEYTSLQGASICSAGAKVSIGL